MKGLFKKAKAELQSILDIDPRTNQPPAQPSQHQHQQGFRRGIEMDQPSTIKPVTPLDIIRYRYHHGTNLGSVYVLERWLRNSMFPEDASGSSELEAVKAWVEKIGVDETRKKFEEFWANAVTDEDIKWLVQEARATSIRLPIGYYDLLPSCLENTPFAPYSAVYTSAWSSISSLVMRLRMHGIGTLLDLHALPGGANTQDHSGTNSGVADLWVSQDDRNLGIRCCQFLAQQVVEGLDGVIGIQIANECEWGSPMNPWYNDCIDAISAIDASIPVIISDGWNLENAINYSLIKNTAMPSQPTCPVVVDTHYYWAHTGEDTSKSPQQIINEASTKLSELNGKEGSIIDRGAAQVVVGEYSCVLSEDSWSKRGDTPKQVLVKEFGEAQSRRWQQRSGGSFFWTWKMDWFPGGEWGFQEQTSSSAVTSPPSYSTPSSSISALLDRSNSHRDERMYAAVNQHTSYWDHLVPNTPCEHWRYENGWKVGYKDAQDFFQGASTVGGGNKIGNLEIWVLKRVRESGMRGNFVWEFEQGLRRGIHDLYAAVGI
ncbi:glucan 1,3-beta-glucosidase-like protein [Lindgomyces ingoldianus]|uniref:Glucan 1,3-beta-glucosidase-like protein n=1 Tax=Lindgomyces ingoldianus TaxID=673940 RepID=A0ACB6RCQ2_9PLEO|nr:glucan 1,3-beta-glucosidase-like protein [Lindgomyces ingoldianus]KAF2476971.1 glucan 1,3-beta-glucosidase-like protein [Lindgomyces ingoldianus]